MILLCCRALHNNQRSTIPVVPRRENVTTIGTITRSGQSRSHPGSNLKVMDRVWQKRNLHKGRGGVMIKITRHCEGTKFCLDCHFLPVANINRNDLRQLIGW